MDDMLVIFAASPTRQFLPERLYFTFMSLYHPHFPDAIESLKIFLDDKIICSFLQNESLKIKEVISLEDKKIPKGLTPLEISISSNDVGDKKENKEEE